MASLKQMLDSTRKLNPNGKILLVVESLHSMDGDFAPLEEIIRLKTEAGAWLLLDEAHAGGICGPDGSGRAAELGLTSAIDLQMGTLGKALGSAGGFIAGQAKIIDHLLNEARTFLFGTALPPASARAALTALSIIQSTEGERLRQTLRRNITLFRSESTSTQLGPIHPILCTTNATATASSKILKDQGLEVPAIRTPTVPTGTARLRISLSARHSESEIRILGQSLKTLPKS
jgi:7-keto-8-aminopelargonate synthetase-like enzyme